MAAAAVVASLNGEKSIVKEEEKKKKKYVVSCVVSGISAGLPGSPDKPVFREDNLKRLVMGDQCIHPISET